MINDHYTQLKNKNPNIGNNIKNKSIQTLKTDIFFHIIDYENISLKVTNNLKTIKDYYNDYIQANDVSLERIIYNDFLLNVQSNNMLLMKQQENISNFKNKIIEEMNRDIEIIDTELRFKNILMKLMQNNLYHQIEMNQNCQLLMKKQLKLKIENTLKLNLIDNKDDIDLILKDPSNFERIININSYKNAKPKIANALKSIQEKLTEINKLNENVQTLINLIKNISIIVIAQSNSIESIYENITSTKDYISKGIETFQESKKAFISKQQKFCLILVGSLIISLIAIFVLANQLGLN